MDSELANSNIFSALIAEQLSSVCFVQDYLQIDFDGYKLTTYTNPVIVTGNGDIIEYTQDEYKNRLCNFIAVRVRDVRYTEKISVEILFQDYEEVIKILLKSDVDNIYYSDYEGRWFVV